MEQHIERGLTLFNWKRYRDAVVEFTRELGQNPQSSDAYFYLATALIHCDRFDEALEAAKQGLALAPDESYGHYLFSFLHLQHGTYKQAEQSIREAIRLNPTIEHFHRLAEIFANQSRHSDVLAATADALLLNPLHAPSLLLRGNALAAMGRLDDAQQLIFSALAEQPESAAAQLSLGKLQLAQGYTSSALETLTEARRLDPLTFSDVSSLGLAYGRLLRPFRMLCPFVVRWYKWPHVAKWAIAAAFALISSQNASLLFNRGASFEPHSLFWTGVCIILTNLMLLPFTFDLMARAAGLLVARRKVGSRWFHLAVVPLLLTFALVAHAAASLLGYVFGLAPELAIIAAEALTAAPLIMAMVGGGPGRLSAYVCFLLAIILAFLGVIAAAIIVDFQEPIGYLLLVVFFAITFFSDKVGRSTQAVVLLRLPPSWIN